MAVVAAVVSAAVAVGVGIYDIVKASQNAQQTKANVGDYSNPTPASPSAGTPAVGTPDASTEAQISQERYAASQTAIGSQQAQLAQQIGQEKIAETQAEGGITANTAARGLKLEGSPLMQLIAQKQSGANAIQYTQQQGTATIKGYQTAAQAALDTAALSGQEQIQQANNAVDTAWLTAFTGVIGAATNMVETFWKPSAQSSSPNYDYSNTQNYWDY